jgi:hypothetical protein
MSRKRKARKSKKPEGLIDRRGFVTTVAGTVVGGVILGGLNAIHMPRHVNTTPLAAITPGPPVKFKLTLTFGTPAPRDDVYRA